jgi:hypothetical protein
VQTCDEDEEKDDQFFSFSQVVEHRWNETNRGKPKYSGKNLSQCHFVHHKSHKDRRGIESGPPRYVLFLPTLIYVSQAIAASVI